MCQSAPGLRGGIMVKSGMPFEIISAYRNMLRISFTPDNLVCNVQSSKWSVTGLVVFIGGQQGITDVYVTAYSIVWNCLWGGDDVPLRVRHNNRNIIRQDRPQQSIFTLLKMWNLGKKTTVKNWNNQSRGHESYDMEHVNPALLQARANRVITVSISSWLQLLPRWQASSCTMCCNLWYKFQWWCGGGADCRDKTADLNH